jgi:hypothetical protein
MKEVDAKDFSMNNSLPEFSWAMKRPFYFECHDTIENVVRALETLQGDHPSRNNTYGKIPDLITISPTRDGYTFHYEGRRWDKYGRSSKTAFGDGEIWQHENRTVVVEGTAYIDPWGFYGAMLAAILACFVGAISARISIIICVLLGLGVLAFIVFIYTEDLNRVGERISQTLHPDTLS